MVENSMKLRNIAAALLAALMVIGLAGCGEGGQSSSEPGQGGSQSQSQSQGGSTQEPAEYPVIVGDLHLNARPEKVVSLSPALTELLCDLGYSDRLSGVSDLCDYPANVTSLTQCGTAQLPDLEAIGSLKPNLLLTSAPLAEADLTQLQQMNVEVAVLPRAETEQELRALYDNLARLMEGETTGAAAAEQFADAQFGRLTAIRQQVDAYIAAGGQALRGSYLSMLPRNTATGDTMEHVLLEAIGLENEAGSYTGYLYPEEKVPEYDPDVVFYNSHYISAEEMADCNLVKGTAAEKSDAIYPIDGLPLERQGVRMFDAAEEMAKTAYPDAFA